MEKFMHYAEEHPWLVGALTLGAVFILLWLFGFFGGSSQSNSSGTNLAASYYAAEAAQTTAATNLQMATVAYGAQTAQTQIQATAAQGIAATQAGAATTINGQNAGVATALGTDQLLATENSNDDALQAANTQAYYNYQTGVAHDNAVNFGTWIGTVVPAEIAKTGGIVVSDSGIPGYGTSVVNPPATPAGLVASGYTPAQADYALNLPGPPNMWLWSSPTG